MLHACWPAPVLLHAPAYMLAGSRPVRWHRPRAVLRRCAPRAPGWDGWAGGSADAERCPVSRRPVAVAHQLQCPTPACPPQEASNWLFPSSLDAAPPLILRLPRRLFGKKKNGKQQAAAAPPPPAHARIDLPGGSAGICASANDPQLALTIDEFEAACEKLPDAELAAVPPEPQQYSTLQYGIWHASTGAAQGATPGALGPVPFVPGVASRGLEVAATAGGGGFCQGGGCAGGHADTPQESSNASTPAQQAGQPGGALHRHSPNSQSSLENRLQDLPPEQRASYMPGARRPRIACAPRPRASMQQEPHGRSGAARLRGRWRRQAPAPAGRERATAGCLHSAANLS